MTRPFNAAKPLSRQRSELLSQLLRKKNVNVKSGTRIPKREDLEKAPVSLNQEGLWYIDRLDPGKANYNIPGTVRLRGWLDIKALESSLTEIVRRHEILRTVFPARPDGTPCQVIQEPGCVNLKISNLEALPAAEREREALERAEKEARKGFDLATGPLFRAQLLRLAEDENVLLLNIHHIVCDGWSMGVFTRELATLYSAYTAGKRSPLKELPIQFADVAVWERQWLQGRELERRLSYWREQLDGGCFALDLPFDWERPSLQSFRGKHLPIEISLPLTKKLQNVSKQCRASLFMTLLTAFGVLLFRHTRQRDLVVGTGIANRDHSEVEELIGYFTTVLPLRIKLDPNTGFRALLDQVRDTTLGACTHYVPLSTLVKDLKPERDTSRNPLFQVEFTLLTPDHNPAVYGYGLSPVTETHKLPGLTLSPLGVEGGVSRYDLAVFLWESDSGLNGTVEFCTDLFHPQFVHRLVTGFQAVLSKLGEQPKSTLDELVHGISVAEREELARIGRELRTSAKDKLRNVKRKPIHY